MAVDDPLHFKSHLQPYCVWALKLNNSLLKQIQLDGNHTEHGGSWLQYSEDERQFAGKRNITGIVSTDPENDPREKQSAEG